MLAFLGYLFAVPAQATVFDLTSQGAAVGEDKFGWFGAGDFGANMPTSFETTWRLDGDFGGYFDLTIYPRVISSSLKIGDKIIDLQTNYGVIFGSKSEFGLSYELSNGSVFKVSTGRFAVSFPDGYTGEDFHFDLPPADASINGIFQDWSTYRPYIRFMPTSVTQRAVVDTIPTVPEIRTWAMMIVGFCAIGLSLRRRRTVMLA